MRCFIAIDISEDIREQIAGLVEQLRRRTKLSRPRVKWVEPGNIHLTLKFLGEVADGAVGDVCGLVEEVSSRHSVFEIGVGGLGVFGRPARVLWVGTDENESLLKVQADIEEGFSQAGWGADNRKFSGHLTLCRIRNTRAGIKLAEISQEYKDFRLGVNFVDSVTVYQSQLTPKGPIYTPLGNYKLAGGKFG